MTELQELTAEYIRVCNEINPDWENGVYTIKAKSGESASFNIEQKLSDSKGLTIRDHMVRLSSFGDTIITAFKKLNVDKTINRIDLVFEHRQNTEIKISWDQNFYEESIKYIPKVKLDKLRAWYLPDDGSLQEPKQPPKLPKPGVQMDTTNLTLDKAFFELNKAVVYKEEDTLWDGGYYLIKHNKEGWIGDAMMYLYDSQESKDKQWRPDEVDCTLTITEEIKKLFLYIQEHYSKTNPSVPFDTLGVEVSPDGSRYTANFELDDIDVFPDAPPKPEKITAAYLSENLKNCLAYNAPDSYKWLWEVLTKTQTEDGETQLEGRFYYSLHEDKSDPQQLEPGEYIFMYHVSERLFDEFLTDTQGWSQIVVHFHVNGKVTYQVLKR